MNDNWYVRQGGKTFGPFPFEKLLRLDSAGKLHATAAVAQEGCEKWESASAVITRLREPQPSEPTKPHSDTELPASPEDHAEDQRDESQLEPDDTEQWEGHRYLSKTPPGRWLSPTSKILLALLSLYAALFFMFGPFAEKRNFKDFLGECGFWVFIVGPIIYTLYLDARYRSAAIHDAIRGNIKHRISERVVNFQGGSFTSWAWGGAAWWPFNLFYLSDHLEQVASLKKGPSLLYGGRLLEEAIKWGQELKQKEVTAAWMAFIGFGFLAFLTTSAVVAEHPSAWRYRAKIFASLMLCCTGIMWFLFLPKTQDGGAFALAGAAYFIGAVAIWVLTAKSDEV